MGMPGEEPIPGTLMLAATPTFAAGSLTVSDAWMRAMPAGIPSGGYFTLRNGTAKDMVLTGAATPLQTRHV